MSLTNGPADRQRGYYFTRYDGQVRKVLEALLDTYADEGLEDMKILTVNRLKKLSNCLAVK